MPHSIEQRAASLPAGANKICACDNMLPRWRRRRRRRPQPARRWRDHHPGALPLFLNAFSFGATEIDDGVPAVDGHLCYLLEILWPWGYGITLINNISQACKGAARYDGRKICGFFDPLSPCPHLDLIYKLHVTSLTISAFP